MEHLGIEVPDEPPICYIVKAVLDTFYLAQRGRIYVAGAAISPLPLNVEIITHVVAAHPVLVGREILDSCIFAIDDLVLDEMMTKDIQQ